MTIKLKKFVKEYQTTGKGNEAVKRAGYNVTSDASARAIASRL
jgi:phage terminase small subunit